MVVSLAYCLIIWRCVARRETNTRETWTDLVWTGNRRCLSQETHVGTELKFSDEYQGPSQESRAPIQSRWGESMAIAYLEKPKGCLKTLRLIDRKGEATIRELIRETSLSQNSVYSSLNHLTELGLIEPITGSTTQGTSKEFRPTQEGEELLRLMSRIGR